MTELGFGIVGCGSISNWHAKAIARNPGARLVGVTDVSGPAREDFARRYSVRAFASAEKMFSDVSIDVVCICTPSGLHAPLALLAAKAGKHIVVEKPMALNLQEADAIIDACESHRVRLAVIAQLRFSDAVARLKHAVDEGALGTLVSGDVYMKFHRTQEYYDSSAWKGTWKMDGGGALMNQGIHGIDLLQYVMGPVKSVFAQARTLSRKIEVEDAASALLEFGNGALGVIQGTTCVYPGSPRLLEINGDRGTIVLEEDCVVEWSLEGREAPEGLVIGRTASKAASDPTAFGIEGHVKQIGDMVSAVREGRSPLVDQREGRKPIELIMAIYESSRTGKLVMLD